MRIWDLSPRYLCNKHLIAEHGELHSLWSVILNKKKGFSKHPETNRWRGKLKALYNRHEKLVKEIKKRGYNHNSPLDKRRARGRAVQDFYLASKAEQKKILKKRSCKCFLN